MVWGVPGQSGVVAARVNKEHAPAKPVQSEGRASYDYATGLFKANFWTTCSHESAHKSRQFFIATHCASQGHIYTSEKSSAEVWESLRLRREVPISALVLDVCLLATFSEETAASCPSCWIRGG